MENVEKIQTFWGSGPNRGQSPVEWGEILFVYLTIRPSALVWLALRPCWLALTPCWLALRPLQLALRPLQLALKLGFRKIVLVLYVLPLDAGDGPQILLIGPYAGTLACS